MVSPRRRTRTLALLFLFAYLFFLFDSGSLLLLHSPSLSSSSSINFPHPLPPLPLLLSHLNLDNTSEPLTPRHPHNLATLTSLHHCVTSDLRSCTKHQTKVVLLGAVEFDGSEYSGWVGGEAIWAASVLRSLRALGYSFLFSTGLEETRRQYEVLGEYVKVVIVGAPATFVCLEDTEGCTRTEDDVRRDDERRDEDEDGLDALSDIAPYLRGGIPAWKIFSFHFWSEPSNPLGAAWTLSPEPYHLLNPFPPTEPETPEGRAGLRLGLRVQSWSDAFNAGWRRGGGAGGNELKRREGSDDRQSNFYLGYSIEDVCTKNPLVPRHLRKFQAYLFAKHSWFFSNAQYAWSDSILNATVAQFDLSLLSACDRDERTEIPKAVTWLGTSLPQKEFLRIVGEGVAMVGVGDPPLSPSPYDALCLGVPFINPILDYSISSPHDRTQWYSQQNTLRFFDPPYVYNVHRSDGEGFLDAVRGAIERPIEGRFIPEHMQESAMRERVKDLVEGEWLEKAMRLLEVRKRSGEGALFVL